MNKRESMVMAEIDRVGWVVGAGIDRTSQRTKGSFDLGVESLEKRGIIVRTGVLHDGVYPVYKKS